MKTNKSHHGQIGFTSRKESGFNDRKQICVTDHIKRIKVEKMIFHNKYRNTFDNIQLNDYKNKS